MRTITMSVGASVVRACAILLACGTASLMLYATVSAAPVETRFIAPVEHSHDERAHERHDHEDEMAHSDHKAGRPGRQQQDQNVHGTSLGDEHGHLGPDEHEHEEYDHGTDEIHADHSGHDHEPGEHARESDNGHAEQDETRRDAHGHAESDGHDHAHAEEEPGEVHLRPEQRRTLGIRTERLELRSLGETLRAPGEVRLNAYASAQIAPRVDAQVIQRHARLGDHVEIGQPMVTLSSVEMAEAQGNLVFAEREWQRVRQLDKTLVSDSRHLEALVTRQQARARVIAYGMTPGQVDELLRRGASRADGSFVLLAPQAGTVVSDDFILGEVIVAGRTLFAISDESVRWIQARMPPADAARATIHNPVRVSNGEEWLDGRVIQIHHEIDEETRTQALRVEVPDPDHQLHPGDFVDVEVHAGQGQSVMALPEAAVYEAVASEATGVRSPDGDWQVFVAGDEPGAYVPKAVRLIRSTGGLAVIEGLPVGTEVVTHGAFFLASELAKGGFDPHNH